MKLRDYQFDAVDAPLNYFLEGGSGNPIVAMPTGTGKSVVIASFIRKVLTMWPGQRILVLTHVKELIKQNFGKFMLVWPTAPAGIYSAGLSRKDSHLPITFAGIGSIHKKADLFGHIDLVLIDECHLVSHKDTTMYRKFLAALQTKNNYVKTIGYTATPYRNGQGYLTEAGGIFTDICIDMTDMDSFNWFFDNGYLCRLKSRPMDTQFDLTGVAIQGGEYNEQQLQLAVDKASITAAALDEALRVGANCKRWLVFGAGVDHAIHITDQLLERGIKAACVHSKMDDSERDKNIADFLSGKLQALVNNGILTTGFDCPEIDLIVVLRPTRSANLWVQMLGRGTRTCFAPGYDLSTPEGRLEAIAVSEKPYCLVLDFARNTEIVGPINDPVIPRAKGKGGNRKAPTRLCPDCDNYCHASVAKCSWCGYEFPRAVKFEAKASVVEVVKESEAPVIANFTVERITYSLHQKADRPVSLRVTYYCGLRKFEEWVCFNHEGYARHKAHNWWRARSSGEIPKDTHEAFERVQELNAVATLKVWVNKKYPEILGCEVLPI